MRLPNFLGIGAQKSGTTWLHHALSQHPDLFLPGSKELMFFDVRSNWKKGVQWYAEHFSDARPDHLCGEITAGYIWTSPPKNDGTREIPFRQNIPKRVKKTLGRDIKLIALFRNPVDRAISSYMHHVKKRRISFADPAHVSFEQCGILDAGRYFSQLSEWLDQFDQKNLHLTSFEQAVSDKQAHLNSVTDFLGACRFIEQPKDERMQFKYDYTRNDEGVCVRTQEQELYPIKSADIDFLREFYSEEVMNLAQIRPEIVGNWKKDFPH